MNLHRWRDLGPSLLVAGGILAGQAAQSTWSDLAGTTALALCLLSADALAERVRGNALRPSAAGWLLACSFELVGALALLREPGHTGSLLPVLGLAAWSALFVRRDDARASCRIA